MPCSSLAIPTTNAYLSPLGFKAATPPLPFHSSRAACPFLQKNRFLLDKNNFIGSNDVPVCAFVFSSFGAGVCSTVPPTFDSSFRICFEAVTSLPPVAPCPFSNCSIPIPNAVPIIIAVATIAINVLLHFFRFFRRRYFRFLKRNNVFGLSLSTTIQSNSSFFFSSYFASVPFTFTEIVRDCLSIHSHLTSYRCPHHIIFISQKRDICQRNSPNNPIYLSYMYAFDFICRTKN